MFIDKAKHDLTTVNELLENIKENYVCKPKPDEEELSL